MVFGFQLKKIISFKGLNCLHLGHLILNPLSKTRAKSKNPQIIPKKRVSKMIVSMGFILLLPTPNLSRQEHLTRAEVVEELEQFYSPD
jgi:hypothetical protein